MIGFTVPSITLTSHTKDDQDSNPDSKTYNEDPESTKNVNTCVADLLNQQNNVNSCVADPRHFGVNPVGDPQIHASD